MRPTLERVDYTEELVIMNRVTGQAVHEQSDFCQLGDSGSWLIDADGCVAGLLFGSISSSCGPPNKDQPRTGFYVNAGLVTSMTEVQKSIRAWTTPRDSNGAPTGPPGILSLPQHPSADIIAIFFNMVVMKRDFYEGLAQHDDERSKNNFKPPLAGFGGGAESNSGRTLA